MPYEPETMTFALAVDGRKMHIDEVANGLAWECVCLKCGGKLVGRHGDVRQHHFSHYLATDGFGCTETALHLAAKAIIQQEKRLILPQQLAGMGLQLGAEACFDSVSLEYRLGSGEAGTEIVADAYGQGAIDMVIEIAVHNPVDHDKAEKIRRLGLPGVEIVLTNSVSSLWDWETLRHAVVADPLRRRHFDRGRVTYRNRWVCTDAWIEEDRAGASPFWGITSTLKGRSDRRLKDSANTDVFAHGGHAVASWYLAGTPYLIDPVSLETIHEADYIRAPGNGFSAHPKVDEHSGELLYFDYGHEQPYMWYGVVDAGGQLVHHVPVELPGARLPHDMAITEHYSILHDLPVFNDEPAYRAGRHKIRFDSALPTRFAVIPRITAGPRRSAGSSSLRASSTTSSTPGRKASRS